MRRVLVMAAVFALLLAVGCAAEEANMRIYIAQDVLDKAAEHRIMQALNHGSDGMIWEKTNSGCSLRELVFSGEAPDMAICSPIEAAAWAREGLLLRLEQHVSGQRRIVRQVLDACVYDEQLFMAPLMAIRRQIAVNTALFKEKRLGYLLDPLEYPIWYPSQFQQAIEEFVLSGITALEVWLPDQTNGAAIETMIQAIYGGSLLSEDGLRCQADDEQIVAGMSWLYDMVDSGMIGIAESKQAAMENFAAGQSAMFLDWTYEEERALQESGGKNGVDVMTMPYPSSAGLSVRTAEVVGVCAFDNGDIQRSAAALQAVEYLNEQAHMLLGSRGLEMEDCVWLPAPDGLESTGMLRSLFAEAVCAVLSGEAAVQEALGCVQSTVEAAGQW